MNLIQKAGPLGTFLLAAMVLVVPRGIEKAVSSVSSVMEASSQAESGPQDVFVPPQSSSSQISGSSTQPVESQEIPSVALPSQAGESGISSGQPQEEAARSSEDDWRLLLVNDWTPLTEDFTVTLVEAAGGERVDYRIQQPLEQMIAGAKDQGIDLMVCSGYRDVAYQETLYNRKTAACQAQGLSIESAMEEAKRWVARPGSSEHHTGLAVDIVTPSYQVLDSGFVGTAAAQWMAEHSAEYGFILRYPQGKEELTGVAWEPWHFRYVGIENAKKIYKEEICLEEFLALEDFKTGA